jgi:hypothetical protein
MTRSADPLVLTIIYGLHMLATVAWIGGLAAFALMILPAAKKGLPVVLTILFSPDEHPAAADWLVQPGGIDHYRPVSDERSPAVRGASWR